ncbi:MAG: GSCFA domain-containing protein [Candidatus Symbiothrix sp.]|jgi:lysophospholipase L1-like esterase|nr:GSCFA domain-containing protein [Candidatus Symbiothrix sp.]
MKFRTEIVLPASALQITHQDKILMAGSCFVENLSAKLLGAGFTIHLNPFGIVYNPSSLANGLQDLIHKKVYTADDLFLYQDVYHSFAHHSRFSGREIDAVLQKINDRLASASDFLRQANVLIITFGTANTYRLVSTGEVVSNCHKLPAKAFVEERLTVEQITTRWNDLLTDLQKINPHLNIIFTVSPIRHWKEGANGNQLNKAILLLAVNELLTANPQCYYFPSYEIMLDDLRDYRFYADDLIHPNSQAVEYIWEKFSEVYFEAKTKALIRTHEKEQKALYHQTFIK